MSNQTLSEIGMRIFRSGLLLITLFTFAPAQAVVARGASGFLPMYASVPSQSGKKIYPRGNNRKKPEKPDKPEMPPVPRDGSVSPSGKLRLGGAYTGREAILVIRASRDLSGPFVITVTDANGDAVGKSTKVEIPRSKDEYSHKLILAEGKNSIVVTDSNDPAETARLEWVGTGPAPASTGATPAPTTTTDDTVVTSGSKKLKVGGAHKGLTGFLNINVEESLKGPLKITVKNEKDEVVGKEKTLELTRATSYTEDVTLAEGKNKITVSDESNAKEKVTLEWVGEKAAASEAKKDKLKMPKFLEQVEEGATQVSGKADPDAMVQIIRNNDPFGDPVRADGEGNFTYFLRANQEITSGNLISARQKRAGEEDTQYSPTMAPIRATEIAQKVRIEEGMPIGYIVGGTVISQQGQEFQQVDPFFGFVAGYRFGKKNYMRQFCLMDENGNEILDSQRNNVKRSFPIDRYGFPINDKNQLLKIKNKERSVERCVLIYTPPNTKQGEAITQLDANEAPIVREPAYGRPNPLAHILYGGGQYKLIFKGMFETEPRTASPKEKAGGNTGGGNENPLDFTPFIASRKSFTIDMTVSYDFPAFAKWFSLGPYGTFGASSVLSKKELQGETVKVDTEGSNDDSDGQVIDAGEQAKSDNDIKKFFEFGLQSNINLYSRKLFLQSMIGYGNYEALDGLYEGHNTKHRFVGHLRIIPNGLNLDFGGQRTVTPMFGVDVNAGRGADHLKFFTGFVFKIRGLQ